MFDANRNHLFFGYKRGMSSDTLAQRVLRWLILMPGELDGENGKEEGKIRNYEAWTNEKTVFLLGGRLRTVRRQPIVLLTGALLVAPLVLFLVFEASWAWHSVSPASVIMFLYCWYITMTSYVRAATQDSGILPRNVHKVEEIPEEYHSSITLPGLSSDAVVKYCLSCKIWRPPRTFHCAICNDCVMVHDHHCVWLGNCIGMRNYRYFFNFLLFGTLSCAYLSALCYYRVFHNRPHHGINSPVTLFIAIFGNIIMLYPLILLVAHIYLLSTQQTTREFLRSKSTSNPYKKRDLFALIKQLCRPRGYSLMSRRQLYQSGDQRLAKD